jgi:YVTN family beta-propeller protein
MRIRPLPIIATLAFTTAGTAAAETAPHASWQLASHWPVSGSTGWDYLALDAAAHRLFVTRSDHVAVLDIGSGKLLGEVRPTEGVHGVALAPALNRGYASNGKGDSVTVFDLKTLATLKTISIQGHNPDAIVFDAPSAHVFTFNGHSNDATVIDAKTDRSIATIALAGKPEFAVSDGAGRVYVNIEDRSELSEIDTHTNKVLATWPLTGCEEPSGLALDTAHHRLFSVCQNGQLAVTDDKSGRHVANVSIGKGPDAAGFDAQTQQVFSSNGEDGTLTVIHEDAPDRYTVLANVPTQKSARTLAIDPVSHRVFLAVAEFEPAPAAVAGKPRVRPTMKPDSFAILVVAPAGSAGARGR